MQLNRLVYLKGRYYSVAILTSSSNAHPEKQLRGWHVMTSPMRQVGDKRWPANNLETIHSYYRYV